MVGADDPPAEYAAGAATRPARAKTRSGLSARRTATAWHTAARLDHDGPRIARKDARRARRAALPRRPDLVVARARRGLVRRDDERPGRAARRSRARAAAVDAHSRKRG